jgi:hypothetical protein
VNPRPKKPNCWFCEAQQKATTQRSGRFACVKCDGFMQQGVICIGVTVPLEPQTMIDKVYRDGNWCVLARDEFSRRFGAVPAHRYAFILPREWQKAGLPRFGKHGASHNEPSLIEADVPTADETIHDDIAELISEETHV